MSIYYNNPEQINSLDEVRLNYGTDRLRDIFQDMLNNNEPRAVSLLNSPNIRFPSLFTLRPEITRNNLITRLNVQNRYALMATNDILSKDSISSQRFLEHSNEYYPAIRWILETGYADDGLDDRYDEVMETAAVILTKIYGDYSCQRIIEEMIFGRYRKGSYIYDLTWAFFETINTNNLLMVVERLRSPESKDVELARKFLNFIPCINDNSMQDPIRQYQGCIRWLNQNFNFLYYTGETNQQTSNPRRYAISLEAKYLQRNLSGVNGEAPRALNRFQTNILDNFKQLDEETKVFLSDCSDMLYRRNRYRWGRWLESPVESQIETARRLMGGLQ